MRKNFWEAKHSHHLDIEGGALWGGRNYDVL